jgi:hypothetical protein
MLLLQKGLLREMGEMLEGEFQRREFHKVQPVEHPHPVPLRPHYLRIHKWV